MKLYQSEMPGPFKEERLTPRLADTARNAVGHLSHSWHCLYAGLLAGRHAPSMRSVTGFQPSLWAVFRPAARASVFMTANAIEAVAGLFSLLSAFNFTLWYVVITRRTFKPIRRSPEVKFFLAAATVIIAITAWQVWACGDVQRHR